MASWKRIALAVSLFLFFLSTARAQSVHHDSADEAPLAPRHELISRSTRSLCGTNGTYPAGWVSSTGWRSSFEVLWSCLATLFACSCSILRLNVPGRGESEIHSLWRKVKWMVITVIFPELIAIIAITEFFIARETRDSLKRLGINWTLTHSFFANMGGFVLESEGLERFPVDARMIEMLIKADVLAHPEIDIREIQDKSKRDSFARLFAGSQVLWVVVQCIARRVQELPVTPLEFLTAEFVLLSMFTYLFEWCKPDGVCVPIVLRAYGRLDDDLVNQLRSKFNQSYNKEFTTVNDIKRIPFGPAFRTFFVSQEKATNSWQSWAVYMLVCCGTGAFNGIRTAVRHQLMPPVAWTVWRISILISVVVPFVGCVYVCIKMMPRLAQIVLCSIVGFLYFLSRVGPLAIALGWSWQSQPASSYYVVQWTEIWPHF
ncbi:hypothetical protein K402DRAFT_422964 [Aulographum hederae CBS 113979]|uniref:Transmembrane protein n=1 Tax=Aulographum hederae CBS 113979 TaxID=1176131 RepID=A0A6G1GUP3_9PEZI|nr:hypothetical protein K402DRAFT_422964 [Aulographum hederae CBS 113979]